jgi:hypothetical protein
MPSPEASRRNLEEGRANWRPPQHWRSPAEAQLIRCVCWQWYTCRGHRSTKRELARHIGVSHTFIQNLLKEFSSVGAAPPELFRLTFYQALVKLKEEQERRCAARWNSN